MKKRRLLEATLLQADETTLKVKNPEVKGKTSTAYIWTYGIPGAEVVFDFTMGRSGDGPIVKWKRRRRASDVGVSAGRSPRSLWDVVQKIAALANSGLPKDRKCPVFPGPTYDDVVREARSARASGHTRTAPVSA